MSLSPANDAKETERLPEKACSLEKQAYATAAQIFDAVNVALAPRTNAYFKDSAKVKVAASLLATFTHILSAATQREAELEQLIKDHEECAASHRHHVRRLDVIWNGESGAAKQAALIDVIAQIEREYPALRERVKELEQVVDALRSEIASKGPDRGFIPVAKEAQT